jgi:chemotaxis protein MotB
LIFNNKIKGIEMKSVKTAGVLILLAIIALAINPKRAESQLFYSKAEYNKLKNEKLALKFELDDIYKKKVTLEKKLKRLTSQYNNDKLNLEKEIRGLKSDIANLEKKLEKLRKEKKEEKRLSDRKIRELQATINLLKKKSSNREQELLALNKKLQEECGNSLNRLKEELRSEREKHIKELNRQRKDYEKQIAGLKERIENLNRELAELKRLSDSQKRELARMSEQTLELEKQLEEEIRLGQIRLKKFHDRLIINIDDKISFNSGSARLKKSVLRALGKISGILVKYPENRIVIEGHTDNVPIVSKRRFRDNWHLSTERALSVLAYILKKNRKLERSRFSAAGYGEFHPIVPNDSKKNRALNRRVDIVVIPRVKKKR